MTAHPAKFGAEILEAIAKTLADVNVRQLLDPFAGTGRVHDLGFDSVGVEIEPEWATMHPRTIVGNALRLPFATGSFDAVATSATYGNRLADHHNNQDPSDRNGYKFALGRNLHPDNSGQLQWGTRYRMFHWNAWLEVTRVLAPGGTFVLNMGDHYRANKRVRVVDFHRSILDALGYVLEHDQPVPTPGLRRGANGDKRVGFEHVLRFRRQTSR